MALLPAVCQNCGLVWEPPAIGVGPVTTVTIDDVQASPCPRCGGVGRIPDGVWRGFGDAVKLIARADPSQDEIRRYIQRLRHAQQHADDPTEALEEVKAEANWLFRVADVLVPRNPTDTTAWIQAVIAVLMAFMAWRAMNPEPPEQLNEEQVTEIVERVVTQVDKQKGT